MSEFDGVKVPAPEGWSGDLFVRVEAAVERSWHEAGQGRVSAVFPVLTVSTYPFRSGERYDERGSGVKYRGRVYFVEEAMVFGESGATRDGWLSDARTYYRRGYKNESGSSVDWKSPMRSRLWDLVAAVRDAYVADHPEWEMRSKGLRLRQLIDAAETRSADLRDQADKESSAAEALRRELAILCGVTP